LPGVRGDRRARTTLRGELMVRQILIRVAIGIVTLWAVSIAVFFGTWALPGDAARAALGRDATPALVAGLQRELGLDRPLLEQYADWIGGFVQGDLGRSLPTAVPVTSILGNRILNTAVLTVCTMILLIVAGMAFGVVSALRPGRPLDQSIAGGTILLIALPEFVIGTLLILVLSVWLGWLPPVSLIESSSSLFSRPTLLILPVLTLLAATLAATIRMIRATMIDVLDSPYVEMARLKGVKERDVVLRHALPNALGPAVQVLALNIPWLVGGIVVVESVFEYHGLGLGLVDAVSRRDLPTVQAATIMIAAAIITTNLVADIVNIVLNPKLRRAR
jgi:peptide/nickel transport system permease protein